MKRFICFLMCIVLAGALFTGCGGQKESGDSASTVAEQTKEPQAVETKEEAKSPETVTITWSDESLDDVALANFQKYILDPMAEKLPYIKIDYQTEKNHNDNLKVKMAAGDGPDMFAMSGPVLASEFANADRLKDLSSYVAQYGWDKIIFPWALDACKVNGKVYSIPASYEGLVLWYNVDMLQANGWEVPKTYADLEKIANECKTKGLMPFAFGTSDFKPANEWFYSVALNAYCGNEAMKKVLTGEAKWTDEPYKGAISLFVKMWQDGWITDKKSHSISTDDSTALFLQERAPFKMEGTWFYSAMSTLSDIKFKYDMALFPSLKDGVAQKLPLALGGCYGIGAASKYADQAAEVINWLYTNVDYHAKAVEAGQQTLPIDIPGNLFTDKMNPVQKKMIKVLVDAQASGDVGYCSWTFWPPKTESYMAENIEKVFLNIMTVDDYLKNVQVIFDEEKAAGKLPVIP